MFQKINKQHVWGHGKIKIRVDYLVLTGIVIRPIYCFISGISLFFSNS